VLAPEVNVSPKTYYILGIGGEHVVDHHAATRPIWRALELIPRMLRDVLRVGVGVIDGGTATLADCVPADGARRVEIRLQQHGRQRLRIRDVVEVGAHLIERQPVAGVDVERQQSLDGAGVLRTVETLEGPTAGVRGDRGPRVEVVLQGLDQRQERVAVRSPGAGRRHHPGPELADHPLGHGGVIEGRRHVEVLQRQVAPEGLIVVAGGAGATHHLVWVGGRGSLRETCHRRAGHAARETRLGRAAHEHEQGEEPGVRGQGHVHEWYTECSLSGSLAPWPP